MGKGIGLEIGNSVYFYDKDGEFSYFSHDEYAKRVIIDLIQAGYIDCLHSYGDGATSRDEIVRALDVLHKADCKLDVWVNHYGARSNLGAGSNTCWANVGGTTQVRVCIMPM